MNSSAATNITVSKNCDYIITGFTVRNQRYQCNYCYYVFLTVYISVAPIIAEGKTIAERIIFRKQSDDCYYWLLLSKELVSRLYYYVSLTVRN